MKISGNTSWFYSAVLFAISTFIAVLMAEAGLRMYFSDQYYVWPPNLERVFKPSAEIMPGVSGESRFSINASGIRAEPFSKDDRYRILAIGGSTTECLYLDEPEAWPYLLQQTLNERLGRNDIWVGNVGKSGQHTRDHILHIEKLIGQYPPN